MIAEALCTPRPHASPCGFKGRHLATPGPAKNRSPKCFRLERPNLACHTWTAGGRTTCATQTPKLWQVLLVAVYTKQKFEVVSRAAFPISCGCFAELRPSVQDSALKSWSPCLGPALTGCGNRRADWKEATRPRCPCGQRSLVLGHVLVHRTQPQGQFLVSVERTEFDAYTHTLTFVPGCNLSCRASGNGHEPREQEMRQRISIPHGCLPWCTSDRTG